MVLIRGSMFDYREWSKLLQPLAKDYRVIAYSRRYHWPNAAPAANADASLEVHQPQKFNKAIIDFLAGYKHRGN